MIYKILSLCFLASTAVLTAMLLFRSPQVVYVEVKDGAPQVTQTPNAIQSLLGFEDATSIHIHVSYNNLTEGQAKTVWRKGNERRFVLMGEEDGTRYRCVVSEEFWRSTSENSFVEIPKNQCMQINP